MAPGAVEVNNTNINAKQGASFDGVDDFVSIPHNANQLGINLSNGFTISAWVNPKSLGGGNVGKVLDKSSSGTSAADGFFIRSSTNQLKFRLNGGTEAQSTTNFTFGTWHHFLITISSGQLANIYHNGVLSGAANQDLVQTISTITTTNAIRIGNVSTGTTNTFDGTIKDVKMWNRVLTASEIPTVPDGKNITNGQILWFKLQKDYLDSSATGLTGTNSGTHFAIVDDAVAAAIKADRTTANDQYMIATAEDGQIITAIVEEAP